MKRMMRSHRALLLFAPICLSAACSIAIAQATVATAAKTPEFDAVSIRPSGPKSQRGWEGGPGTDSPTLFRFHSATLQDLIARAWNVSFFQISSATPVDKDTFDVDARLPNGATKQQFRSMLQDMLARRFELKTHLESKQFSAYELLVAKSGLKLKEYVAGQPDTPQGANSSGPCGQAGWPDPPPNVPNVAVTQVSKAGYVLACMTVQRENLSTLAYRLPKEDKVPVVDRTGLTGLYSFHFEYAIAPLAASADVAPAVSDLSSALKEQLGLQLQKSKLPFDVIVVESFNKMPTEN